MRIQDEATAVIAAAATDYRQTIRRFSERIPSLRVVAEASNGREALMMVLRHKPDVAILDVLMPIFTGREVLEEIRRRDLPTRVLLMAAQDCPEYWNPVFWNNAQGYLFKDDGLDDWMVPALKAVISGRHFASPTPLAALRDNYAMFSQEQPQNVALTRLEADVLQLTVRGKSDKEMARALNITVRAVEKRKARLRKKFGVQSTVELAVVAATQRLLDGEETAEASQMTKSQNAFSAVV